VKRVEAASGEVEERVRGSRGGDEEVGGGGTSGIGFQFLGVHSGGVDGSAVVGEDRFDQVLSEQLADGAAGLCTTTTTTTSHHHSQPHNAQPRPMQSRSRKQKQSKAEDDECRVPSPDAAAIPCTLPSRTPHQRKAQHRRSTFEGERVRCG
jgi:hypothetical protein